MPNLSIDIQGADALAWVFMFLISALWIREKKALAFRVAAVATAVYLILFLMALIK